MLKLYSDYITVAMRHEPTFVLGWLLRSLVGEARHVWVKPLSLQEARWVAILELSATTVVV